MTKDIKKHIVIVTSEFPPQPGGIGNHAYNLAVFLSKNDYQIQIIADQRSVNSSKEDVFDKNLPFLMKRIKLRKWRILMYFNRIIKTFKASKQADFIIATGKFSLWNVAFCSLFLKRPTMAVLHGSEVNFKPYGLRTSINLALKRFDSLVAVSNYTKQLVVHLNRAITVIPNGIDLDAWLNTSLDKKKLQGFPVLTTVGRVSTRKGQLQVIKLLPELIKVYPEIHYHCVGIPTEADAFMSVAKSLDVDKHVSFHGAVDDTYLKQVLLASDVFVMLSTESRSGDVEGFGIAILEANALGIPAIGSKGCGIEDAVKDGVSGFLINGQDALAFKSSIASILNNQALFETNSKNWAQSHDWNAIIKQYIDLIT